MQTIDKLPDVHHRHRFVPLGSHTLHVGHKAKGRNPYPERRIPIREVRLVRRCRCGDIRVSISRHLAVGLPVPISVLG